jgi:N-acetylglucosamine kinase-like BadF-type ATPase
MSASGRVSRSSSSGKPGSPARVREARRIPEDGTELAVGVDLGATWTRVTARWQGRTVRRLQVPAVDVGELEPLLRTVWPRWRGTPSRVGAMTVASRGIWTAAECRRLERLLRRVARRIRVISDAQAAYEGALGPGEGLLVLSGTGSIVVGRNAIGIWGRSGGLGPLLGDDGSAFWIGREWLRATTTGRDFESVRSIVHGPRPVARIAALAPRVLTRARGGDRLAGRITREAQRHLAQFALMLSKKLGLRPPVRMSWAGSLLVRNAWFRAGLQRAVGRAGLRARWIVPHEPPIAAAARLAEAMLAAPAVKARPFGPEPRRRGR